MKDRKELLDKEALEKVAREFLEIVDPDPDRDGLKETPKRVAKYWIELLEGQKYTNDEIKVLTEFQERFFESIIIN